jgi:sulfite dehydrogenase
LGLACTRIPSTTLSVAATEQTPTITTYQDLIKLEHEDPAKIDNTDLPITPVDQLHVTGTPSDFDIAEYRRAVDGLVETPLSLTYDDIKNFSSVTETVLLICPEIFVDNARWTGVPIKTILDAAGLKTPAFEITFRQGDQYKKSFFINDVERDGVFLAYMVNDQVLPREHGFPLRLVVKGEYGLNWVKWVDHIDIN